MFKQFLLLAAKQRACVLFTSMEDTWDQYRISATRAFENKSFRESEGYWAMAALIALQWGESNNRYLYSLYQLSNTALSGNNMPMAEMVTRRILALQSGTLKSDILEQASMAYKLSEILFRSSKFDESLTLCRQILSVYESRLDRADSRLNEIRSNIAMLESKLAETAPPAQPPVQQQQQQQQQQPAQQPVYAHAQREATPPVQQQAAPTVQQQPPTQSQHPAAQANQHTQNKPASVSYARIKTQPVVGQGTAPQAVTGQRIRASDLIKNYNQKKKYKVDNVCQLCGRQFQGGWCGKCTGTKIEAINPADILKRQREGT